MNQDDGDAVTPVLRVEHLAKRFRRDDAVVTAIDDVSFEVRPGEMVVLVGPSGCGKTTLLRAVAGLEQPDRGVIELHGRTCFSSATDVDVPTERRRLSMVFQNYALWPHLTAFENVVYPLRANRERRRLSRAAAAERVHEILRLVDVAELADQHPNEMSGGQRQRVALARALVAGTDLVLFDEPLSNVDAKVRATLRLELLEMQRRLGFSALFVTHDQAEAMALADRIAVMGGGRIHQFGVPSEVYHAPATRYVADFIGSINEVHGTVLSVGADVVVETPLGPIAGRAGDAVKPGQPVIALWRPERMEVHDGEPDTRNRWKGTVSAALFLGAHTEHIVEVSGHRFLVWSADVLGRDEDDAVWVVVDPRHVRVMPVEQV